ncbi:MAG: cytochrome-c oxidase, cbb3-type subunit III, partial [Hyphomicrobiales bacterium]
MDQKHDDPHVDAATGMPTTGHEWDGIRELNTPLPRWWLGIFYASVIWSIGYWIVYPAWPLLTDTTKGVIGYASRSEISVDMARLKAQRAAQAAGMADATPEQIKADPTLFQIAMAQGKAAFGDNCAACHGVGGAGAKGYPNLNDDDWLWGGSLPAIQQTIRHGIRVAGDNDTRVSQMPAFGRDGVLKREEILAVASHVRELTGLPTGPKADLALGRKVFADN